MAKVSIQFALLHTALTQKSEKYALIFISSYVLQHISNVSPSDLQGPPYDTVFLFIFNVAFHMMLDCIYQTWQ